MVSAANVCIVAVAFVAMMATICVAPPPPHHGGGNWKCKPNDELMKQKQEVQGRCYEEATGKTMPPPGAPRTGSQEDRPSKEEMEAMMLCVATEMGIIKDGEFDAEQAKELTANNIEADDDIKQAISDAIDECDAEDEDALSKLQCTHKAVMTVCKGE